ncbi:Oidioi.mRNA.OKI2018_I69.chr2.g5516.t1.cds [Oikopleura dioica]|uniref:Oidioi.mRNA.OKI2018_I69.chr2.g5516.t1.cds n=1 Tax=Oikopleura dioica TaxID=34765 RepID=A0ABN7T4V9_OIKDI|nr:Oidioi.mRNA.OKI2018_I69.chr2.g5516.t1.cds [Oikopleura dioica]
MQVEIEKAKLTFEECKSKKIECNDSRLPPATPSKSIQTPKLKLSEFLEIMEEGHGSCEGKLNHYHQAKMLYETGSWAMDAQTNGFCRKIRDRILSMELDTKVPIK